MAVNKTEVLYLKQSVCRLESVSSVQDYMKELLPPPL